MKLTKNHERIIMFGVIAAPVTYFCYQVVYGISESEGNWQIKPVSVFAIFCSPTTSPTQMFNWNWCIW